MSKIKPCELAKIGQSRNVASPCCLKLVNEPPQRNASPGNLDLGSPPLGSLLPTHPLELRGSVSLLPTVGVVLGLSSWSKVLATIVQAVKIDMVNRHGPYDQRMHEALVTVDHAACIHDASRSSLDMPPVLRHQVHIALIDKGTEVSLPE